MIGAALRFLKGRWTLIAKLAGVLAIVSVIGYGGYSCGARSRDAQIADLTTKLATSEQTIEIERGIVAKKSAELTDLADLLAKTGAENERLAALVKRGQMEILTLNQLVVKWKKAYEAAVEASQTEEPPVIPDGPPRKKVTFSGRVGPITVDGHTLTDPPEAFLKWSQIDPLRLTLIVTKNKDGTFSSIVSSSDDDIATEITVSAVDVSVVAPTWKQRIWVNAGVDFLGDRRVFGGVSYHFDRLALGAECSGWTDGSACGLTVGFRPFK